MKEKVLLDIDGVIANFYASFAKHLNDNLGLNLDISSDPSEYNMNKWGPDIPGLGNEISKWINNGGFENMPSYDGAKEFVLELLDLYDVYIVTARIGDFKMSLPDEVIDKIKTDTLKWFKELGLFPNKIVFEHNKIDFCKENNISIIIEDKLPTVIDGANKNISAILMDRPWNQSYSIWNGETLDRFHKNIHVAFDYGDVFNILDKIINGS